jgi:hypothetical protein
VQFNDRNNFTIMQRKMSDYWASVKWQWQGKLKYWENNLSQCHFVHHKSHMDLPKIELVTPEWQAGDKPSEPQHSAIAPCTSVYKDYYTACAKDLVSCPAALRCNATAFPVYLAQWHRKRLLLQLHLSRARGLTEGRPHEWHTKRFYPKTE